MSGILIIRFHVEVHRVDLFVVEDAEVGKSAAAACGGHNCQVVGSLLTRCNTGMQTCSGIVAVAATLDCDAAESACAGGAARARAAAAARARSFSNARFRSSAATCTGAVACGIQTTAVPAAISTAAAAARFAGNSAGSVATSRGLSESIAL